MKTLACRYYCYGLSQPGMVGKYSHGRCNGKSNLNYTLNYTIKEGRVFKEITNLTEKYEDALIVLS
jgi:hypothetical protein